MAKLLQFVISELGTVQVNPNRVYFVVKRVYIFELENPNGFLIEKNQSFSQSTLLPKGVGMKGQFFPFGDSMKTRRIPIITYSLVTINVFVFALSFENLENTIYALGFTPAIFPSVPAVITIFTSIFLHGGIDHLFGNMWYLWIFGDNVEDKVGRIKFVGLYLASGAAASLVQYFTNPYSIIPAVGASGAISGVLGWYYVFFPKARITTSTGYFANESPAWVVIGFWFLIQLFFGAATLAGFSGSNVAFFAHIGGFAFGYLAAKAAKKLQG